MFLVNSLKSACNYGRYSSYAGSSSWGYWSAGTYWASAVWTSCTSWPSNKYSNVGSDGWYTCSSGFYIENWNSSWSSNWGTGAIPNGTKTGNICDIVF